MKKQFFSFYINISQVIKGHKNPKINSDIIKSHLSVLIYAKDSNIVRTFRKNQILTFTNIKNQN